MPCDPGGDAVQAWIYDTLIDIILIQHIADTPAQIFGNDVFDGLLIIIVCEEIDDAVHMGGHDREE